MSDTRSSSQPESRSVSGSRSASGSSVTTNSGAKSAATVPGLPAGFTLPVLPLQQASRRVAAQDLIDNKTKPLGSLGRLEDLAVRVCTIQDTLQPRSFRRLMLVFAGDHGLVEEGVSAFPQEVTVQMVHNFVQGGAAINVLCRQYDIDLKVVDAGVKGDLSGLDSVLNRKVALGTANAARQAAMSEAQLLQALRSGMEVFNELNQARPVDLLGLGEMGIGNTSAAALLIAARSGVAVAELTGRGTGLNYGQLSHKQEVLQRVFALHELDKQSAFEQLRRVGGFEIAQMAGAAIAAAVAGVPVVLDGVISTAAGLMADALLPGLRDSLIIAHRSVEHAQAAAAGVLGLDPVVDLGLRLGEGSGAAITLNLVDTACRIFREMASFAEAGVSTGG